MTSALTITQSPGFESISSASINWQAADPTGNTYFHTGREMILARNISTDTVHSVTIRSTTVTQAGDPDHYVLSLPVSDAERLLPMRGLAGWTQPDGTLLVVADSVEVELAVIRLPI